MIARGLPIADAVGWVKPELMHLLASASEVIEARSEGVVSEQGAITDALDALEQFAGATSFLELHDSQILASELVNLLAALVAGRWDDESKAVALASTSVIRLKHDVELLNYHSAREPLSALSLVNEIRECLGTDPLCGDTLFFPEVRKIKVPRPRVISGRQELDLRVAAVRLRPVYESGLVALIRGRDPDEGLRKMLAVVQRLYTAASEEEARRLWWIGTALIEALALSGRSGDQPVQRLLGWLDREIKRLIEFGERNFASAIPDRWIQRLLYHVGTAEPRGRFVKSVQGAYALKNGIGRLRDSSHRDVISSGIEPDIFVVVMNQLRDELSDLSVSLEAAEGIDGQGPGELAADAERCEELAGTLSMIGFQDWGAKFRSCAETLRTLDTGAGEHESSDMMDIASTLVAAQSMLAGVVTGAQGAAETEGASSLTRGVDSSTGATGQDPELVASVVNLVLEETERLKDCLLGFAASPASYVWPEYTSELIDTIRGAIALLEADEILPILDAIASAIPGGASAPADGMEVNDLQALADAMVSLQCYCEGLAGRGAAGRDRIMEVGRASAERLSLSPASLTESVAHCSASGRGDALDGEAAPRSVAPMAGPVAGEGPSNKPAFQDSTSPVVHAEAVPDRFTSLAWVVSEPDDEILEVFQEEVAEAQQNIRSHMEQWRLDPNDRSSLAEVRRSFHTLKGSGRLIGAELMGEVAWIFEDLLNKTISGERQASALDRELVGEVCNYLPMIMDRLRGGERPPEALYRLMTRAQASAQGAR